MKKLSITKDVRHEFKIMGVDCINNVEGVVYLHGSMKGITAAISKILLLNPGAEVQCMDTATIKVADGESAIVNACVIFSFNKQEDE